MSRPVAMIMSQSPSVPKRNSKRSSRAPSGPGTKPPSRPGRRASVADSLPRQRSSSVEPSGLDRMAPKGGLSTTTHVRRWDGSNRTTDDWDSIRRDPELWFPSGDCLVHLYAEGQSRRGPSIRLALSDIEAARCMQLVYRTLGHGQQEPESPSVHDSSSEDGGYHTNPRANGKYELYIPAPAHMSREDAFNYHLTTRNIFAWMFDKPIVGAKLGEALIALQARMDEFRPDPELNQDDLLAYIDSQAYSDFRDCPDHALALLQYAEELRLGELWTDAFVHCAGMNDTLVSSHEFKGVSKTSMALINRASLEMGVRLERASASLSNFMEDDLSSTYLSLSEPKVKHIERFRTFLQSFYVQKHGYWPPYASKPKSGKRTPLPKHTLLTMYTDFRNLYEFLADPESLAGMQSSAESQYTTKAVTAFDRRHRYNALPMPLPLLPASVPSLSTETSPTASSRFQRFLPNKKAKLEKRTGTLAALQGATNVNDPKVMSSPMVRAYSAFEREFTIRGEDDNISALSARATRWLVVYAIFQTLVDVTRAPEDVRDIEGVEYPLCCQTAGTPPWTTTFSSTSFASIPSLPATASDASTITGPSLHTPDASSPLSSPTSALSAKVAPLDLDLVATKRLTGTSTASAIAGCPSIIAAPTDLSSKARPKVNKRTSLSERLANTTISLIFAPIPRYSSVNPENLLASEAIPPPQDNTPLPTSLPGSADNFAFASAPHIARSASARPATRTPARVDTSVACLSNTPPSLSPASDSSGPSASSLQTPTSARFGPLGHLFQRRSLSVAPEKSAHMGLDRSLIGRPMPIPIVHEDEEMGPPSPSVYGDDVASPAESVFSFGGGGKSHKRESSSELAKRWREQIQWREGPGWETGSMV